MLTDAMNGLAERLEGGGSFNIEVVITPLKDMISTAIMEYHGSTKAISDQVSRLFSLSGKVGVRYLRESGESSQHGLYLFGILGNIQLSITKLSEIVYCVFTMELFVEVGHVENVWRIKFAHVSQNLEV